MSTTQQAPAVAAEYRPFSSGTEEMDWSSINCHICRHSSGEELPICCGEYGIGSAAIGNGNVSVLALDFIGTTSRTVQDNGDAFCELNAECNQFEIEVDVSESGIPKGINIDLGQYLNDARLAETVADKFAQYGYKLTNLIANL